MATTQAASEAAMRHGDWMTAAETEYARLLTQLRTLPAEDWARPTDCAEWDVRQLVAHLVGAAESTASLRELRRQQKLGRRLRPDADEVDAMNAVQVEERAQATQAELIAALADVAPRAIRARRRIPAPVRAVRVPFGPPLGVRSIGYLMGRIYTRDAWMHRVDIARATGAPLELTPQHDGRLVADVVEEWAAAHGRPYALRLTGVAGGSWSGGTGGEPHELDAVEFCRIVSGRATASGLLGTRVPF